MGSQVRLIDDDWARTFDRATAAVSDEVRIVCPFIQRKVVDRLLRKGSPQSLRVITRFCLSDFCEGVSSTAALRVLLGHGAQIRGVKHLHAKMYIFGGRRAIVTSANLTDAALRRNYEVGLVIDDPQSVAKCQRSFEDIWVRGGDDLTLERLEGWEREINGARARGLIVVPPLSLRDEGCNLNKGTDVNVSTPLVADANQAFVKFWGESTNRVLRDFPVMEEVERAGCHWACTYPKGKRPRQVENGALMYMGRLVRDPADTMIFGRALALEHEPGRDDATRDEQKLRPWKSQWSHYIRVYNGQFLDGTMADGVSLGEMMDALGPDSFASTQRNARTGSGNTNPRNAYRQQPAVRLSRKGQRWIDRRLQAAFDRYGMIPTSELATLDWPTTAYT